MSTSKFEQACADYAEARLAVKKATLRIGAYFDECTRANDDSRVNRKGGQYSHVSQVLEWEVDDHGNESTYTAAERDEVLAECPGCQKAWQAIQARREWRKKFGIAKRRITLFGNQILAAREEPEPEIATCGCGATGEVNYDDGTERRYYCYSALSMCSP